MMESKSPTKERLMTATPRPAETRSTGPMRGTQAPGHWGDLADEFIACKAGTSQSLLT